MGFLGEIFQSAGLSDQNWDTFGETRCLLSVTATWVVKRQKQSLRKGTSKLPAKSLEAVGKRNARRKTTGTLSLLFASKPVTKLGASSRLALQSLRARPLSDILGTAREALPTPPARSSPGQQTTRAQFQLRSVLPRNAGGGWVGGACSEPSHLSLAHVAHWGAVPLAVLAVRLIQIDSLIGPAPSSQV